MENFQIDWQQKYKLLPIRPHIATLPLLSGYFYLPSEWYIAISTYREKIENKIGGFLKNHNSNFYSELIFVPSLLKALQEKSSTAPRSGCYHSNVDLLRLLFNPILENTGYLEIRFRWLHFARPASLSFDTSQEGGWWTDVIDISYRSAVLQCWLRGSKPVSTHP